MPQPKVLYPGQPTRKRSKVAIVGYTAHRNLAPFSDPDWDVWFLNDLHHEMPKVAPVDRLRLFQIHPWHDNEAWAPDRPVNAHPLDGTGGPAHNRDHGYVAMIADWATKIPVYLMDKRQEVPGAVIMPRELLFDTFTLDGVKPNKYFTNSVSWQIGLAILEGYEEIGVYGVDMMMAGGEGSEYGYQRPSCEFFMGVAQGRGIKVHLPQESDLLKTIFVYGDKDEAPFRKNLAYIKKEYEGRMAAMSAQREQASVGIHQLTGAVNTIDWILRGHLPGDTGDKIGTYPEPDGQKIPALAPPKQPVAEMPKVNTVDQLVTAVTGMDQYMRPRAALLDRLLKETFPDEMNAASDSAGDESVVPVDV